MYWSILKLFFTFLKWKEFYLNLNRFKNIKKEIWNKIKCWSTTHVCTAKVCTLLLYGHLIVKESSKAVNQYPIDYSKGLLYRGDCAVVGSLCTQCQNKEKVTSDSKLMDNTPSEINFELETKKQVSNFWIFCALVIDKSVDIWKNYQVWCPFLQI